MKGLQRYLPLEVKFLFTSYAGQIAAAITAKISVGSMLATLNFLSQIKLTPTQKIIMEPVMER